MGFQVFPEFKYKDNNEHYKLYRHRVYRHCYLQCYRQPSHRPTVTVQTFEEAGLEFREEYGYMKRRIPEWWSNDCSPGPLVQNEPPVAVLMIKRWDWSHFLRIDVQFSKIGGEWLSPVAGVQNSRWRPRWPPTHICSIISGSINDREVISVSKIWFSGSRNSNNLKSIMSDHHVTLETVVGQGHMA